MGGAASVESIWASERVRNEYERYCRQVAEGTEEDLGYDLDPLDDASVGARFDIMFRSLLQEKDKIISESVGLHPVTWVSKYNEMSEEQKGEYCKAVVEAQVQLDKATYKPKAAEADYSKSFSGSAADTKAEKEAAALMKGEGGEGEEREEKKEEDMNPLLSPPSVTYNRYIGNPDLIKRYDRLMLLRASPWCKWFSQSGCYMYIQIANKEIVSIRPNSYEEAEDMGGGILTEEELNGTSDGSEEKPKGGEVIPDGVMVCTMADLPSVIDEVVDEKKKTPLILDASDDRKVKTFFDYKYRVADASPLCVPFAKSGLKRQDCLESYRKILVGALKAGTTFALYLGDLTQDEANFKKMCKKDCFPIECVVEAGKKLLNPAFDPRYKKIMRAEDIDQEDGDTLKNPDGFRSVVISALKPAEYESKLADSLPLGYMQPIYISSV